jgi:hypothetical protein
MIIEINGKKIGIKLGNYAIEKLPSIKGQNESTYIAVSALVWCGYLNWCVWKQQDPDPEIEFGTISDWVDTSVNNEDVAEQIRQVYDLYQETEAYKKLQKKSLLNGQLEAVE